MYHFDPVISLDSVVWFLRDNLTVLPASYLDKIISSASSWEDTLIRIIVLFEKEENILQINLDVLRNN
jgi:hypothetical protein